MKSSRAKRDRPFKNVAKQPNGAEHSKASMRRILGSVSGNMQAALNPTKPSSIPPFFKSAEEISRDTSTDPAASQRNLESRPPTQEDLQLMAESNGVELHPAYPSFESQGEKPFQPK